MSANHSHLPTEHDPASRTRGGAVPPEPGDDASAEELESDIARTRRELGETVSALSDQLNPKVQAQRQVEAVTGRARARAAHLKTQAMGRVESIKGQARERIDGLKSRGDDRSDADAAPETIPVPPDTVTEVRAVETTDSRTGAAASPAVFVATGVATGALLALVALLVRRDH